MANDFVEVIVYGRDDPLTPLDVLNGRIDPSSTEEHNGLGSGSFKISITDPKVVANPSLLDERNVYRVKVGDVVVGAFIGKKKKTEVVSKEAAEELYVISGYGLRDWLNDAVVYPQGGLKPSSRTSRSFNFSSQIGAWYKASEWVNVHNVLTVFAKGSEWGKSPEGFPKIPGLKAIWGTPATTPASSTDKRRGHPNGKNYFRGTFTLAKKAQYTLYVAGDDHFKLYVDGEHIASTNITSNGWSSAYQYSMELDAGQHVVGVMVENKYGGPGALAAALYQGEGPKEDDNEKSNSEYSRNLVWSTGNNNSMWKALPYPKKEPAWTAGEIMLTLINEAKARGVKTIGWLNPTFTATHDSRGHLWETLGDWTFGVGDTYNDVLERLEELFVEGRVDPVTLDFNMSALRGTDRSVYRFSGETTLINSFRNPEARHTWQTPAGTGPRAFMVFDGTGTLARVSRQTPWTAAYRARITRPANSKMRIGFEAPWETAGRQVAVAFRLASSRNVTVSIYAEPNATAGGTAGRSLLGTRTLTGGAAPVDVTYAFTAPATAPEDTDTSYIVIEATDTTTSSSTLDVGDVVVVLDNAATNHSFWSGDSPSSTSMSFSWAGEPHNSASVKTSGVLASAALVFEKGKNLTSATIDTTADVKNALIVRTSESWFEQAGGTVGDYGRVESILNTDLNVTLSKKVAAEVFRQRSTPEEAASYALIPTEGHVPFTDFYVGDWVLAPDSRGKLVKRRVMSISVAEDNVGRVVWGVEFDSIYEDAEDKIRKFMERQGGALGRGGFANATSGMANPIGRPEQINTGLPSRTYPNAPETLSGTTTAAWSPDGMTALAEVNLTWSGVTVNTDGSLTVPEYYEVEVSVGDTTVWNVVASTNATTAKIENLVADTNHSFRVRAFNSPVESGDYSPTFTIKTGLPNTPMTPPNAPTLSSHLSVIQVNWDGTLGNNVPPLYFRYAYAEVANGPDFTTYRRIGAPFLRDTRTITISDNFKVGQTYRVRLVAVDGLGIKSEPSAYASVVVQGIDGEALTAEINQKIIDAGDVTTDLQNLRDSLDTIGQDTPAGIVDLLNRTNSAQKTAESARGENLILNGSGELGDTTNWPNGVVFKPESAPTGFSGAFGWSSGAATYTPFALNSIAVDTSQPYRMRGVVVGKAGMRHYLALRSFDIDGLEISHWHANRVANTETTLAAALNPGQTTITLTSSTGWGSSFSGSHALGVWPYINSLGQTFNVADGYTRNVYSLSGATRSGNVITLASPWSGPALTVGTQVTQQVSGAQYVYPQNFIAQADTVVLDGTVAGVANGVAGNETITTGSARFRPGTTKVVPGMLLNHSTLVSGFSPVYTGLRFEADGARQIAFLAQQSANGRNNVINSNADATGTTNPDTGQPNVKGDVWWKWDNSVIVKQWQWTGTAWAVAELNHQVLASVDLGKATVGELHGQYIKAGTVTTGALLVGQFDNLIADVVAQTASPLPHSAGTYAASIGTQGDSADTNGYSPGRHLWAVSKADGATSYSPLVEFAGANYALRIPVVPNRKYHLSALIRAGGSYPSGLPRLRWAIRERDSEGTQIRFFAAGNNQALTWIWTDLSAEYVASPNAATVEITMQILGDAAGVRIANPALRNKSNSVLIEDGAVIAQHLGAESVTAIAIAADAVSASKMLIADFTNLIEGATFPGTATTITSDPTTGVPGWTLETGTATVSNTTGLPGRTLVMSPGIGVEAAVTNNRLFEVSTTVGTDGIERPSDFYLQAKYRNDRSVPGVVQVLWFDKDKNPVGTSDLSLPLTSGTTWATVSTSTSAEATASPPVDARYGRVRIAAEAVMTGTTAGSIWIGNVVVRQMSGGELIVDGTIYGRHIISDSLETRHFRAQQIEGEHLKVGTVKVANLEPLIGNKISIAGNVEIIAMKDLASGNHRELTGELASQRAVYNFDAEAAKIAREGSPYAIWIKNDRIEIRQGTNVVSEWDSGQLRVDNFVGTRVTLAKHQMETHSSGSGTVIRALGAS
jgi:hypothetical protein